MNLLDAFIRQYVAPVAKAAGFTKSGRTFRLVSSNGDQSLLGFSTHFVDPARVVFDVDFFMVPVPYWDWLTRQDQGDKAPDRSGALATGSVIPPSEAAHQPDEEMPFRARWAFEIAGNQEVCGQALGEVLRGETIPKMRRLLDRAALLEELSSPSTPMAKRMNPLMREIILKIDDSPIGEIDGLLTAAQNAGVLGSYVQWARQRLAARSSD